MEGGWAQDLLNWLNAHPGWGFVTVLLVAFFESLVLIGILLPGMFILFGVGALVANIPLAGLWTFVALILAIVQVGPGLVIVPVVIYAWSSMETVSAVMFTAYMVPVMLLDNVLKPIVMGRGLPVPMLVIFIGVIGGTMAHGLIGLFVGPIVLSMGYELAKAWIQMGRTSTEP